MKGSNVILGPLYLFTWLIASSVVLLNMIVAILGEVYNEVSAEDNEHPLPTVMDAIRAAARKRLDVMLQKKQAVEKLTQKVLQWLVASAV